MREIKFRAWHPHKKIMQRHDHGAHNLANFFSSFNGLSIGESTLMQYTGLKDKSGVEIYEGDIVHYLYQPGDGFWNHDSIGVLVWRSTGFDLQCYKNGKKCGYQGAMTSLPGGSASDKPNDLFKVIGNVHENPELLK